MFVKTEKYKNKINSFLDLVTLMIESLVRNFSKCFSDVLTGLSLKRVVADSEVFNV